MTRYEEFLAELKENADPAYREFNKKLLKDEKANLLGVRVPVLRKTAKKLKGETENLLSFPDDYYEIKFIKLAAVSFLPYEEFIKHIDRCVPLIDNWALCDCFAPECIAGHKEDFLPYIKKYLSSDKEFYRRFALTTLLHFYVEEVYMDFIFQALASSGDGYYYEFMAAAWLTAEMLVKFYPQTTEFLKQNKLPKRTHNKAITKACESFRISAAQKKYLKELKR